MEESMRTLILNMGACISVVAMTFLIGCSKSESQNPSGTFVVGQWVPAWDGQFRGRINPNPPRPPDKTRCRGESCIILETVHPIRLVPFQSIRFFSSAVSPKVKQSMFRNQVQHLERERNEANEFGLFEILQALPIG